MAAFPMLEDALIESWQEGMGIGNPKDSVRINMLHYRLTLAGQAPR
jgi:hypothetical protein